VRVAAHAPRAGWSAHMNTSGWRRAASSRTAATTAAQVMAALHGPQSTLIVRGG
jgi:hypothetical protein